MKHYHYARLLKLAEFLEALPRKQFDFGEWGRTDAKCGTVACAAGWATFLPCARRLGFKPDIGEDYLGVRHNGDRTDFETMASTVFGLDIDSNEFNFLFIPGAHGNRLGAKATPKKVAKHIRRFVKRKQAGKEAVPYNQETAF